MDRTKSFIIDLCNYDVTVIWSDNMVKHRLRIEKKINEHTSYSGADDFQACHIQNFVGHSWILLPTQCPASLAVHEISHCVDAVMLFCTFEDNEVRAHIAEHLAKRIL